jgi:hypothetical protein
MHTKILARKPERKESFGNVVMDGRMILSGC